MVFAPIGFAEPIHLLKQPPAAALYFLLALHYRRERCLIYTYHARLL